MTKRTANKYCWETFSRTVNTIIIIGTTIRRSILKDLEWHLVLSMLLVLIPCHSPKRGMQLLPFFSNEESRHRS